MLPATLLLPSDNKPLQWALKSILGACTAPSDNATMPGHSSRAAQQASSSTAGHRLHQLTRAHQATRWQLRPPQATSTQKTQQNQARIGHIPRENQPLLMTLCPPIIILFYIIFHDNIPYDSIFQYIIPNDNI